MARESFDRVPSRPPFPFVTRFALPGRADVGRLFGLSLLVLGLGACVTATPRTDVRFAPDGRHGFADTIDPQGDGRITQLFLRHTDPKTGEVVTTAYEPPPECRDPEEVGGWERLIVCVRQTVASAIVHRK